MARQRTSAPKQPPRSAEQFRYGQILRFACLAMEVTPEALAEAVDVNVATVLKWFEGQAKPRVENHVKAFAFLRLNSETTRNLFDLILLARTILEREPEAEPEPEGADPSSGLDYRPLLIEPSSEITEGRGFMLQAEAWIRSLIRKEIAADRKRRSSQRL